MFINYLRYLRRVLFHRMVISALIVVVLCLCQDFKCLMTGSVFRCFCNNSSVILFLLLGE